MKLSIVIPCYNEAKNIPLILEKFASVVKRPDIEVIIVDNNSKDDSAEVLRALLPKFSFARSVFEPMPGYGSAVLSGLRSAKGDFIGWTHGDLQTPPGDVLRALEIIEQDGNRKGAYVKGFRRGRPFTDTVFTVGMGLFESLYFGRALFDVNGQPNVFHRSFFESWKNPPTDFALDLYSLYLARKQGLRVLRFNVVFPQRLHGESTWNRGWGDRWKFIKRTISFSKKLKSELRGNN